MIWFGIHLINKNIKNINKKGMEMEFVVVFFIVVLLGLFLGATFFNQIGKKMKSSSERFDDLMPDRMVNMSGFVDLPKVEN